MKKKEIIPPFRPDYPDMTVCGKDEYILSWRIKDWDMIHRIQDYFGMPRYTTLNRLSKIKIKRDDPKWNDFLDGLRKGIYWLTNVSIR
jgi:hypothetical protein